MLAVQTMRRRDGFTLVELIVVITIILLITALGAALLPRFLDNQNQTRAVDQFTQWLLTAKQRAKRDGVNTGIRILPGSDGLATQMMYVQQPEPYTAGTCQSITANQGQKTATFVANSVDFQGAGAFGVGIDDPVTGGGWIVQPGDYLELNGGGPVYVIDQVEGPNTLILLNTQLQLAAPASNYRIIRQPRRLLGEDMLTLPQDMAIDLSLSNPLDYTSTLWSRAVPSRQIGGPLAGGANVYEIMFTPQGNVVGQGTVSGKIIIWMRNTTKDVTDPGAVTLVCVQIRTGFIAAHPISVDPTNYYQFAEDGKSSGL